MPFTEDQDAVGELGSGGQDGVERPGELAGSVADEESKGGGAVVEVHQEVAGLLGGPGSSRMARRREDVHVPD